MNPKQKRAQASRDRIEIRSMAVDMYNEDVISHEFAKFILDNA